MSRFLQSIVPSAPVECFGEFSGKQQRPEEVCPGLFPIAVCERSKGGRRKRALVISVVSILVSQTVCPLQTFGTTCDEPLNLVQRVSMVALTVLGFL